MHRVVALVVVAHGLSGCLRPSLVDCGELACASTQVCHEGRCLDENQLEQCLPPATDGSNCEVRGANGHCRAGVCEVATCGDGVLDEPLREECEAGVPSAEHCVDLGYDVGRPGCADCQTDSDLGCVRFGWEHLVDVPTTAMWTDGATFAYLTASRLEVHGPGGDVLVDGVFSSVHGGGGTVLAWTSTVLDQIVGATSTPISLPGGVTVIDHARVGSDGRIYLLSDCTVRVYTGTQWTIVGPKINAPPCTRLEVGPGGTPRIFVVADASGTTGTFPEIYELNRTTNRWVVYADPTSQVSTIRFQQLATEGALWFLGNGRGVRQSDSGVKTTVDAGLQASTIGFTGDTVWFGDNSGRLSRYRDGQVRQLHSPGLVTTDGTDVYSYRGPVLRFRGIAFGAREALSAVTQVTSTLDEGATFVVLSRTQFHTPDPDQSGWTTVAGPSSTMRAIAGAAPNFMISTFTDTPSSRSQALLETTGGLSAFGWTAVAIPTNPVVYGLWRAPDATIVAIGDDDAGTAVFGVRRGSTWTMHSIPGCTARGVDGSDSAHVVVVGACADAAVVWSYDGTTWAELARPALEGPLSSVARLADDAIVAVGMHGATRYDGTTWHVDADAIGDSISATSLDDIWIAGPFTSVQRFDGSSWSRLAITGTSPISVVARPDSVLFPGANEGFVELVR